MTVINQTQSLQAGIQSALNDTWRQNWPVYKEQQSSLLHFLPWSSIRKADYGWKERVPFPVLWRYGTGRTRQIFRDRKITISIYPYDLTQIWSGWDADDDQLDGPGGIRKHVSMGVKRFLQLPDVLYTEYFTGVASLNPALALSYDGVNLFSTVDGDGAARFGVTGGNIVTGSGVTTHAKVKDDIVAARRRFLAFQEPVTGQPLFDPADVAYQSMLYVIPKELDGIFQGISEQELIYTDPTINTAQSNFLKGKIKYVVNQRLTDVNDWYCVLLHPYWKAFAYRGPQKVRHIYAEINNSDEARETNNNLSYSDVRLGLGPWAPFTVIRVSNS